MRKNALVWRPSPRPQVQRDDWRLFIEGDTLYEAMLQDIGTAQTAIRMESYIFADDTIGRRFAAALMERARKGVHVRLRVDFAGSRWAMGRALVRELRTAGVRFEWSRPWKWFRPWAFHRRNHRKLLIVDRAVAYVGGFNIHAESSFDCVGAARWRDTHVRLSGPAVSEAIHVFDRCGRTNDLSQARFGRLRVIANPMLYGRRRLRRAIARALGAAQRRIWLTTPYFVPDLRLRRQLLCAARRGVDVRVLIPGKTDVPITQWAAWAFYSALLKAGVRVYEYQPRVLHAKTLVVDDEWATVGSSNLDYRSLFLNAEVNFVSREPRFCETLAAHFHADLQDSHAIEPARWDARCWRHLVRETLAWSVRKWL